MRVEVVDLLKERVRQELVEAGGWITAKELCRRIDVEAEDPIRVIKKRIEELKDEGCPIAALPGSPGPGYLWIHDPEAPGSVEVRERVIADYKLRIRRLASHLAAFDAATSRQIQLVLDLK